MTSRTLAVIAATALCTLAACQNTGTVHSPSQPPVVAVDLSPDVADAPPAAPPPEPLLPDEGAHLAPSLTRLAGGQESPDMGVLLEVERCRDCHASIVEEWRQSPHALSSLNNPLYRVTLDDFVADRDPARARFCNTCHDVALQFDDPPEPPRPEDQRAHAGVNCMTCHGITAATVDGNGSYTLDTSPVPYPVPGDPDSLARHRARVAPSALGTDAMCTSCHRAFIGPQTEHPFIAFGMDEHTPLRRSPFGGSLLDRIDEPIAPRGCIGCHMAEGAGGLRAHRFPGGHTTLARMIDSEAQLKANVDLLSQAAALDLHAMARVGANVVHQEPALAAAPGQRLLIDAVIASLPVGHDFPSGAKDLRDMWLEVKATDRHGAPVAAAGDRHAEAPRDPTAHILRTLVVDIKSEVVFEHRVGRFRAGVYDRTIAPRGAAVVRYGLDLPGDFDPGRFPLSIEATLRHRRVQPELAEAACRTSGEGRGAAFVAQSKRWTGVKLDPCTPQPIIDIARARLQVGPGAAEGAEARPRWVRLLAHGRGLRLQVQEHQEEALLALQEAEEALGVEAPPWARPAIWVEQAGVLGLMGRTGEAEALLGRA